MKEEEAAAAAAAAKSRCVRNYRYELSIKGADADVTRILLKAATAATTTTATIKHQSSILAIQNSGDGCVSAGRNIIYINNIYLYLLTKILQQIEKQCQVG